MSGSKNHFWVGAHCYVNTGKPEFPKGVVSISDTVAIREDLGNRIPDKSWVLLLLEAFDRRNIPIELNLICQFNDRDNFWAIFGGVNRYKFTKVLPRVGHSYLRQIVMDPLSKAIHYIVTDRNLNQKETFNFSAANHYPPIIKHFTGIEWWNKAGNLPFPIRYKLQISDLSYGHSDLQGITTYQPYNMLVPNREGLRKEYPISFTNITHDENAISYIIQDGTSLDGMKFRF